MGKGGYDLAILDVSLPDGSGFDICRDIRRTSHTPIIFLTAADEETDVIMGLDMGGDDYITKPFKLAIFVQGARDSAQEPSARADWRPASFQWRGGGSFNGESLQKRGAGRTDGQRIPAFVLVYGKPGPDFSPEQLLGKLWDCSEKYVDNNTLTVYIRRLRTKIEDDPGRPRRIVTVRGMGYKWNTSD